MAKNYFSIITFNLPCLLPPWQGGNVKSDATNKQYCGHSKLLLRKGLFDQSNSFYPSISADLQIMVYLGIVVTRKYLRWQKILSKYTYFLEITKKIFDFPLHLTEISNIFYQTIKTEVKRKIFFLKSHGKLYLKRWVSQNIFTNSVRIPEM